MSRVRPGRALAAGLVVVLAAAGGFVAGGRATAAPQAAVIPIEVDRQGDDVNILVPVRINGHGPYRFVLDTGASTTAVSRRVLKDAEAEPTGERVQVTDASGATSDASTYWMDSWRAGPVTLHRDAVVTNLSADFQEDGLLGSDELRRLGTVAIDFEHERLLVTPRGR